MQSGEGQVTEIYDGSQGAAGFIRCGEGLIPSAGQYVLASPARGDELLARAIFPAGRESGGFLVAPPLPQLWTPGTRLALRGPLGKGFNLPLAVRRVGMVSWKQSPAPLLALLPQALGQGAEVTLACEAAPRGLPPEVEIQPLAALEELCEWADFILAEVERELLQELKQRLGRGTQGQVLVRAPMPCGALAECGVCTVPAGNRWKLVCKDGPVFDLNQVGV